MAVPTETVYGLAADASQDQAVAKVFQTKGRPVGHPLIVHVPDPHWLAYWSYQISPYAWPLIDAFWPGPLTLLLPRSVRRGQAVAGGQPNIALRMPDQPQLLALMRSYQLCLAAPSANLYQRLSPTSAQQVLAQLAGKIPAVLDAGPCQHGLESTILDLTKPQPSILRSGPISAQQISECLSMPVAQPSRHQQVVPGNVAQHYQPSKPLKIKTGLHIRQATADQRARVALLCHSPDLAGLGFAAERCISDHQQFARSLYAALFEMQSLAVEEIWLEQLPAQPEWQAVQDRMLRAAS